MTPSSSSESGSGLPEETLEALYNINKHAAKYAKLADENYQEGKKATAHANSLKKDALYTLKAIVLREVYHYADEIAKHEIDGRWYYCVTFDEWSFHSPIDELDVPENIITEERELDDFTKTPDKEFSDMSLKDALLHLESAFDVNANTLLEKQYVSYGHSSHFIGWKYLGDES